ncbi:putative 40S ribosomal protein S18 [Paratrimastix pyriformis]|uniref:40S ribosomal protein S18 n=1 Tax=Paratrimastix pyriformis TaxID=342808 RepID=A0ABQ8U6V7_9EUKA|nr:putative 40S ribosomal protein S18 [Paratrimastix pyriformis]
MRRTCGCPEGPQFALECWSTAPTSECPPPSTCGRTGALMNYMEAPNGAPTVGVGTGRSLQLPSNFQHILRVVNTNITGTVNVMYALTKIKGIGRRFSNLVCKKADIDMTKRAGELSPAEIERILKVISEPEEWKIPLWFLNRRRDQRDGKNKQWHAQQVDIGIRDDLEALKKIRCNRGLRHYWGIRVRGQHTKTTGRHGHTIGVAKKKEAAAPSS